MSSELIDGMVSQPIWIAIVIGVFFVGVGASYAHFANTYDPMSMKFQNQGLFDQMMSNNPMMSQQWMDSGMMGQQQMMNDPQSIQQIHDMMMSDSQHMNQMMGPMMNTMMNDLQMQQQMMTHMMNNQGMMDSMMSNQDMMNMMMGNNMMMDSGMMSPQMQGQNESTQTEIISYVKTVDGVQVVTINAKEFKFTPFEININAGKTKFVLINDGVGEHELVVYEASKQDILEKAEIAEDEETIGQNILFEIEEVHGGESGESKVMDLTKGSYVIGCLIPGHYDAGMKGTLIIS